MLQWTFLLVKKNQKPNQGVLFNLFIPNLQRKMYFFLATPIIEIVNQTPFMRQKQSKNSMAT